MKQWIYTLTPKTSEGEAQLETLDSPRAYLLRGVDCGDGICGVRMQSCRADGCAKAVLYIEDGTCIGVVMCTTDLGDAETYADIAQVKGVHDIRIVPEDKLEITKVILLDHSPYNDISYEPVPDEAVIDNQHETWVAVDELGRPVKNCEDVRAKRDRQVGIFYWTWRDQQAHAEPLNLRKVLAEFPGAEYNENHPVWTVNGKETITSWNEPLYGYYLNRDAYVIRRHAVLLANAGVDFIVFDCTNGSLIWRQSYEPLLEGLRAAKADGIRVPRVAFMLNFGIAPTAENMLRTLYQDLYKPGRYRDLWYMLDGKPMIMGYHESLPKEGMCDFDTRLLDEIRNFFTFRAGQPSYGAGDIYPNAPMWGWLEKAPQHKFGEREDGSCEMMTVGVAQNCNAEKLCTCFNAPHTFGRSYTHEYGEALLDETSYKYGYNFQEQWERALDCDPDIVFITGWNEWIMGRWHQPWFEDVNDPHLAFVDQYTPEYSRDIEMDADCIRDNYYLQLCSNIRRYKGAGKRPKASAPKTAPKPSDFCDVAPTYYNDRGTTVHRDCDGFGSTHYTNETGRNDIILAKVARDNENLYFYAACSDNITAPDAENWMTLLLNTDNGAENSWNGYNYVINRAKAENGKAILEKMTVCGWQKAAEVSYVLEGKEIVITVPRDAIGLPGDPVSFTFKWADNLPLDDIIYFYRDGDTAPTGRFAYYYQA